MIGADNSGGASFVSCTLFFFLFLEFHGIGNSSSAQKVVCGFLAELSGRITKNVDCSNY